MAVLTALPPNSRLNADNRRHSDPSKAAYKSVTRNGKGRSSSSGGGGLDSHPHREAIALAPVPEDMPILQQSITSDTDDAPSPLEEPQSPSQQQQKQNRWSKRLSWIPGWSFAGSGPLTPPASPPADGDSRSRNGSNESYTATNTRMSRLRSSISQIGEVVLRDTEPSHESNFPENPTFPEFNGHGMTLHVYGTVDSLTTSDMRLQTPRGFAYADFASSSDPEQPRPYTAVMEYMKPLLRNGDLLVRPFIERYARDRHAAMVIRGAIQDCVFKCMIIGVFPMKMFDEDVKFESYELDVQLYDPEMAVALGKV